MTFRSFQPPTRVLMGPGPSDVSNRVLAAMARPTIGHLDPQFITLMDEIKVLLQQVFRTQNRLTMPLSGPGSAGMEACLVNLLEPGDTAIVCRNGVFGGRMVAVAERAGAHVVAIDDPWGEPVDVLKVEAALEAHPNAKLVAFVHAETSTGVQSDAEAIAAVSQAAGVLTVADCVTSLGGTPVEVDAWGLDAVYSGSQKCLSCAPGLSPITFSDRAVAAMKARKTPVQSWFLDLQMVMGYWGEGAKRSYHHTAPVNALYGLHEALVALQEEGLETAWARHRRHHRALRDGLEALGLEYCVPEVHRLPQLNAVWVPDGVDDGAARRQLLDAFGIEIGGGLGTFAGSAWRIGLMGAAACKRNVLGLLAALESVLREQGLTMSPGAGVAAARAVYEAG